jgi:hypothetical protein
MSKKIEDVLAKIGDDAEAGEEDQTDRPIPSHVTVTRGNPRSKVLQVRLNEDEYAAIERIAAQRDLPVSTVARERLLTLIAEENGEDQPLVALLAATDKLNDLASGLRAKLTKYNNAPSTGAFIELAAKTFGVADQITYRSGGYLTFCVRHGGKFTDEAHADQIAEGCSPD